MRKHRVRQRAYMERKREETVEEEYRHGGLTVGEWDAIFLDEYGHPSNWPPSLAERAKALMASEERIGTRRT